MGDRTLAAGPAFFSIDGQDMAALLNDPRNGGDAGDWGTSVQEDSFDAFAQAGVANTVSETDLRLMDILGYSLAPPEVMPGDLARTFNMNDLTSWAYDGVKGLFYLETSTGLLESYDPETKNFKFVLNAGSKTQGIAVSSDGQFLYVGNKERSLSIQITTTTTATATACLKRSVLPRWVCKR